jgi:LEA14-like dessication related protein
MKSSIYKLLFLLFTLSLFSCAELAKHADTAKPTAKITGTRLANINFEQVDLVFDLAVENKNPVSLKLAGLEYDLKIENQSLVSGTTAQAIKIAANSTSQVQLPITLKFKDLKNLPGELWNKDKIAYQLQTRFNINLPVIGNYAIPVSTKGELPIPKIPDIKFRGMSVKNISFMSADLVARIEVNNPNDFDMAVTNLNYQLNINQENWGQGKITNNINIPKKGKGTIDFPLKLNFLNTGKAAYDIVVNKKPVQYQLKGNATINTTLKLLKNYNMPLDITGTTSLR